MTRDKATKQAAGSDLVLIDGNSLLYRAFFALPPLTNAEGEVTNAAYGFTTMLLKVLDEEQPDMIAVAFDLPGPTFRHEIFEDYKATRRAMPDELGPQFDMAREILDAMHIPAFGMERYEADDVIGTLAAQAERGGTRVLIVTGDLDELQLVSDRVSVMVTRRGITDTKRYDPKAVQERYGLSPDRLADFRALRGDSSDNIPGVPGIGEKTAAKLIAEFGSLEDVLSHVDQLKPPRIASAVATHADLARRAKQLSLIVRDLPIEFDPEQLQRRSPDTERLAEIFRRLDFRSLLKGLEGGQHTPGSEHDLITTPRAARALAARLEGIPELIIHPLAAAASGLRASLFGLCLAAGGTSVVLSPDQENLDRLLAPLKPILESPDVPKIGHDLKRSALLLHDRGLALQGLWFDTMIAAYLVNPARRVEDLGSVVSDYLETESPAPLKDGSPDPDAAAVAANQIASLRPLLEDQLGAMHLDALLRELEMPLIPVLLHMERTGIAVDCDVLAALSDKLGARAAELQKDIHLLAGEEFNISSPVQLRHILFEKLGLPPDKTKRTKSGYSTAAAVLVGLSDYEIVGKILEYREVTKLKSTYVDALPPLVNPATGRIHTSFNQAVTATGRLSSTDPNLQNIPIRTEAGMEIRRAFVAGDPDHLLLSADYSQIELRILAHITEDENLIAIFRRDEDLHRAAAAEIFGVAPGDITPHMRAFAKMVNFGIPYGISDFRLAREMGISLADARRYMERYFAQFPKVHDYMKSMPERARKQGYVETLMGRRRPLPELRAKAPAVRQAAERMAVNTPMQGSAADIIKLAMLRLHDALHAQSLRGRMLLQVHDELLLEVPHSELTETAALVADCMSGAYQLCVPLKVDLKAGQNWLDMKPLT
ncbi:MAG TPA: DNA polymerase I [Armatimonadota bacterium]|nr:DNA polymerase I [Armatimonadota bacterium]